MMNTNGVEVLERFKGLCNTAHSDPHVGGLGRRFNFIRPPAVDDAIRFAKEEYVIRDEEELFSFIARIPKTVAIFMPSPPPSKDALLRHPKIDFQNHMVLVIVAHEPNCFIDLEIVGVKLEGKAMQVLCRYAEPGPIVQKVIRHGAYCAVVVNRFDGDVVFIRNSD
jgi:hypothetical protein